MKAYIAKQSPRTIPVGYSAADVAENRLLLAEYLNCGDASDRVDFYAFNDYEWCGNSTFTYFPPLILDFPMAVLTPHSESGYSQRVQDFSNYSVPLFFSEYGCNAVEPRLFTEVPVIYSPEMTGVFSGGLVYEWTQEVSDYGLVNLGNGTVTLLQDYYNLEAEFKKTPMPSGNGGYDANGQPSTCPPNSTDFTSWGSVLPDTPSQALLYIQSGAGTPLGFNGPSNQGAGASATASVPAGTNTATGTSCPTCSLSSSSSSSTAKSAAHIISPVEKGVAGGALLAAIAALVGAMLVIQ
jgi:1,3-beta-glucanosyltransferase GAS5